MFKKIKMATRDWAVSQKKKFPPSKNFKMLTMCRKCYTFYYKNSWHFEKPEYLQYEDDKTVAVRFVECPACLEQELALYDRESDLVLGGGY